MRFHSLQRSDPVPPPNGAVVTDRNEHLAISWKGGLSNSSVALWIGKDWWSQRSWIRNCKVPSVDLALGVAKGEGLLLQICWEPDKPDFTVSYVQFVNDGCPLLFLSLTLIKTTRLPNHNAVLTRLGKHKVTEPPEEDYIEANIIAFLGSRLSSVYPQSHPSPATVNIVPVDVSGAKVRKVTQFWEINIIEKAHHDGMNHL